MKKILFLTTRAGSAHQNCIEAIRESFETQFSSKYKTIVFDPYGGNDKAFHSAYMNLFTSYLKGGYKALFSFTNRYDSLLSKTNRSMLEKNLTKKLQRENPDVILSAFPFFARPVLEILKENNIKTCFGEIITDMGKIHKPWIVKGLDFYLSPSLETTYYLKNKGISENLIKTLGFPTRQQFMKTYHKSQMAEKYGFDLEKRTILLFGGGYGLGGMKEKLEYINNHLNNFQIIVLCGHNKKIFNSAKKIAAKNKVNKIKPLPYLEEIAEVISFADLVITKAGGGSINELIVLKKPMIIYEVIPGQEEQNAKFVEHMGFGYTEKKSKDLVERIKYIFETSDDERIIKNLSSYHQNDNSAEKIAKFIDSQISDS